MATKTVKRTTAKAKTNVDNTVAESTSEETKNIIENSKKEKKSFSDNEEILCESITSGELGMVGAKTGINYTWVNYGDVIGVEYADLVAAIRMRRDAVTRPRFIIKDEDFLEQFPQMNDIYGELYSISDLKNILKMNPTAMEREIERLPKGIKDSLVGIATAMIEDGRIDSRKTIKKLEDIFGKKFSFVYDD